MNECIYDHFGRFRRLRWGIAHGGDRRYEVITVELPDQSQHTVYFDVTELEELVAAATAIKRLRRAAGARHSTVDR